MKKVGLAFCFLLGACSSFGANEGPSPGTRYPKQNLAPWPWVHIAPSKRALAFKDVEFYAISRQIHYDINYSPHQKIFKNVRLILLDYGVLPAEDSQQDTPQISYQGETYYKNFESKPERYVMTMRFYECQQKPPSAPTFQVTTYLRKEKAAPQEAMHLMAHDIIEELHEHSGHLLKKLEINLD